MPRARRTAAQPPDPPDDELPEDDDVAEVLSDPGDLAALADASYSEWKWHVFRVRSPEDMAASRSRQQTVWVLTLTGPLDVSQLRETVGGGVFRVWGYLGGSLRLKRTFELEGPPRIYAPPAPPPAPAAPVAAATVTAPNGIDPVLMTLLQNQQKTLDAIAARLAVPVAAPGLSFRDALAMAEMMGRGSGGGGVEMKDLVALFQQGIEIGGNAVGGNEKSTLEVILEKGLPALERVAAGMASRARTRPGAPSPARKREPSSAAVVEDPPAAAVTSPPDDLTPEARQAALRWGGAVDALARAIEAGADPSDFADTLDHLLLPDEIELMLVGGTTSVMEQIRVAGDRFPVLLTPDAERFVGAVLQDLAEPAESETPTP